MFTHITLKIDRKINCFLRPGKTQTYILLHGFSGDHVGVLDLALQLPKSSEIIVLDMPGFGESDDPAENAQTSVKKYSLFLDAVIAELATTKNVILIGHSFGAAVGFAYAAQQPNKIKQFIALCPVASKRFLATLLGRFGVFSARRLGVDRTVQFLSWPPLVNLETRYLLPNTAKKRYEQIRESRLREARLFRPSTFVMGKMVDSFQQECADVELKVPAGIIAAKGDNIAGRTDADWYMQHCHDAIALTVPGNHLLPTADPELCAKSIAHILQTNA